VSRASAASWAAVAGGAIIGGSARYGLDHAIPHPIDGFPWSTFLINIIGSFALGWLAAAVWEQVPEWVRAGLGAGVLGAFTTFSAVAVSAVAIAEGGPLTGGPGSVEPGDFALAALVVLANVVAGILAAILGTVLGRRGRRLPAVAAQEEGEDA
jgi:CrcB protein